MSTVSRYAGNRCADSFGAYDRMKLRTVVERFPISWRERLVRQLGKLRADTFEAWVERVGQLTEAERGGIRPDASDADICAKARVTADDFARRLRYAKAIADGHGKGDDWSEAYQALEARALMDARGMLDLFPVAGPRTSRNGILKRLGCEKWWRRTLRTLHARTIESCAIGIGLVSRNAGLYASDEAVTRRVGQNCRNAASLESVIAVNDLGQSSTLAELAAKGTSNKAIRRVELLTRIAGFELIAQGMGHQGYMVTMTCPSRFHRMTTRADGRVVPNPRYDGSTPHDAQKYLTKAWARCRAAAARAGIAWYGFRIAEPQHDGTPHWHCLLFVGGPASDAGVERVRPDDGLMSLVRKYFLDADNPDEPGARKHRVDCEWINPAKGSAVGYVIKYVSKNIDGYGVGLDLEGQCAVLSSQRVEAWAATWRIRQFQQIGGAPVGVWRELRRINPDNVSPTAPDALRVAVSAVNASKVEPGVQSIAWMRYTTAQGGIGCKRANMRLRIMKEDRGDWADIGRYGEPVAPRPLGVDAAGVQLFRNHIHVMNPAAPAFQRPSFASVESERCAWVVTHGSRVEAKRAAAVVFQRSGEAAAPRIHVNNCTDRDLSRVSEFAPVREYRPRMKRFKVREAREVGGKPLKEPHGTDFRPHQPDDDDGNPY